ncbi:MAG: histidine phosphatase family protein [Clostridia bacterium]|nr:histidine phosphatase family protein [Clostridia bacterium]
MRIIFVRHGHPNYRNDCLTELGHEQAAAAAERLMNEGITEIHCSSHGRAYETAMHLAERLDLQVTKHDFIREIGWGPIDEGELEDNGHPWFTVDKMVERGISLMDPDWRDSEIFRRNKVVQFVDNVAKNIDVWLEELGYQREGMFYRVTGSNTNRTVAMFSHAGSSSAAMSHIFSLPFPYFCKAMEMNLTSISIVYLPDRPGELVMPRYEIANDSRHIKACERLISN